MIAVDSMVFGGIHSIEVNLCSFVPEHALEDAVVPIAVAEVFIGPGIAGYQEIKRSNKQVFGF